MTTTRKRTAAAAPAAPKKRTRTIKLVTPRYALAAKLLKLVEKITKLLAPRYEGAGIDTLLASAKESIVEAGQFVAVLPDNWAPASHRERKPLTAEQFDRMEKRAAKLNARIAAARAGA